jgi:DNA-binding GntR family transcriptional regulator
MVKTVVDHPVRSERRAQVWAERPLMTTSSSAARKPPFEVIATHFRERIERGTLKPGDGLPSPLEIAHTWRVARQTVSRALALLVAEGVLVPGRAGPVVAGPAGRSCLAVVLDGRPGTGVDAVELTELEPDVAVRLGVPAGSSLLIVHFTRPAAG